MCYHEISSFYSPRYLHWRKKDFKWLFTGFSNPNIGKIIYCCFFNNYPSHTDNDTLNIRYRSDYLIFFSDILCNFIYHYSCFYIHFYHSFIIRFPDTLCSSFPHILHFLTCIVRLSFLSVRNTDWILRHHCRLINFIILLSMASSFP